MTKITVAMTLKKLTELRETGARASVTGFFGIKDV
jgi:hypothetical protein